jgi:hypothetical protein
VPKFRLRGALPPSSILARRQIYLYLTYIEPNDNMVLNYELERCRDLLKASSKTFFEGLKNTTIRLRKDDLQAYVQIFQGTVSGCIQKFSD